MSDLLEVKNLGKNFGAFRLSDVSFTLPKGFIMGLIGQNGAGKTTTIKLILNMLEKDAGTILVFGRDSAADERAIKERIGVVLDETFYCGDWKISELERVLSRFYAAWDVKCFYGLMLRFGLDRNKRIKELSRGMKLKLMIAAALSHGAELLLLDEPTSGLDASARAELLELLSEFIGDGQKSVLFSTHITSDLEKTADFITFLSDGKVVYTGTKDGLLEKYALIKGGSGLLSDDTIKKTVGYRGHSVGFDALIEKRYLGELPKSVVRERADLDEILIRFQTGGIAK